MMQNAKPSESLWTALRSIQIRRKKKLKELTLARKAGLPTILPLETQLNGLTEAMKAIDGPLYSLLQTGTILLKMEKNTLDITRAKKNISRTVGDLVHEEMEDLPYPEPSETLVSNWNNRVNSVRELDQLTSKFLDELRESTRKNVPWEAFKESHYGLISYLFENVYHPPRRDYEVRQRVIHKKANDWDHKLPPTDALLFKALQASKSAFFNKLSYTILQDYLERKKIAFHHVLHSPILITWKNYLTLQEQADAILSFRRAYLREVVAITTDALTLRKKAFSRLQVDDTAPEAASWGQDAFLRFEELLWNGTFRAKKETFIDSAVAILRQHTIYAVYTFWRKERFSQRVDLSLALEPHSAAGEPSARVIISDFIHTYQPHLEAWLSELDTLYQEGKIGIRTFMEYALEVGPGQVQADYLLQENKMKKDFFAQLRQQDSQPKPLITYQGRVRDGGNKASDLFNERFANTILGLILVEKAKKLDENDQVFSLIQHGKHLEILFPDNFRNSALTDELRLYCLLETLQDSHVLIDMLID